MYRCSEPADEVIPLEYRAAAGGLFPPGGYGEGQGPTGEAALAFAEILGIGPDYRRLREVTPCGPETRRFMGHFQNNLDLLIQKTWVEKADEVRKEKLQDRISPFISGIEEGNYQKALADFASILEELAYLFFGAQSREPDFSEYTFRIDTQMGLFWWYAAHLGGFGQTGCLSKSTDKKALWNILLIGICYLTNF